MIKIASMWNKIYSIALAVLVLAICVLMYLSYSWLQSITNPADVASKYEFHSHLSWIFLWISSAILLVLANVILWKTRHTWAFWATLGYFAIFIILQTFWLDQSFFQYKKENNLQQSGISFSPFLGVGLCVAAAVFVFFNQLLLVRMHDKILKEPPIEELPEAETVHNKAKVIE